MVTLLLLASLFRQYNANQYIAALNAIPFVQQTPIDATALTFTLEKGFFTVRVGRWSIRATSAAEMNRFVDVHLHDIDPGKITVIGDPKAKYEEFAPVLEVLKKHDWLKFRLQDSNLKQNSPLPSTKKDTVYGQVIWLSAAAQPRLVGEAERYGVLKAYRPTKANHF
jgi:hypothetical protein